MNEKRDSWWGPTLLLLLLIAFSMDMFVWKLSGGVEFSSVLDRMILGFSLAFGITSCALLFVSLGAVHKHMRWQEQIIGLFGCTYLGIKCYGWIGNGFDSMGGDVVILLTGLTATLAAVGLVFGLLLALVTGREHAPDPLLDMDSTGGDVSVELDD
jgi:hypothetical protein